MIGASPAVVGGLTSQPAGSGGHGAASGSSLGAGALGRALKVTPSNKRMHATRDTNTFMYQQRCGRARDARR
jgi:hypothetical protein